MCGRFAAGDKTQAEMLAIVRGFLDHAGPVAADLDAPPPRTGYNIKPTQQVGIVVAEPGGFTLTSARWWFVPHWHRKPVAEWKATTFNAKIETAAEKPTFRSAWAGGRCIVPALGYYEWTGQKGRKLPWFIGLDTNAPLVFFAGLHSRLDDGLRTCTILTRPALPQIAGIHDRMPVLLTADQLAPWMRCEIGTAEAQQELGGGWEGRLRFHRVRTFGRDEDGPELIEPFEAPA